MNYPPTYFIEKFSAIAEKDWVDPMVNTGNTNIFALNPEGQALADLFREAELWMMQIDEHETAQFRQETGRLRIIAALEYINGQKP